VADLISSLQGEQLIQSDSDAVHRANNPAESNSNSGEKIPFAQPVLNKFTDVEDLLMLDPIHDVDAAGWPQKR
jgi:hypothetical protein